MQTTCLSSHQSNEATFVIIGGGIAGVTCVEHLFRLAPEESIILLTASPVIKTITDIIPIAKTLFSYKVVQGDARNLEKSNPRLRVIYDKLTNICSKNKEITTKTGHIINYKYLCLCTGGIPNILHQGKNNPRVIGIRDTDSIKNYQTLVSKSKRVVVVGNGGIASELVHATKNVEIVWVIKDKHITSTFVDPGAAHFLQTSSKFSSNKTTAPILKRFKYGEDQYEKLDSKDRSAALGPDWLKDKNLTGLCEDSKLTIKYNVTVLEILSHENNEWPLRVILSDNSDIHCDLLISATGVIPTPDYTCDENLVLGNDGGISVNMEMESSIKDIFAAGDACFANWDLAPHWFQMRLWTQAYQMGGMAARSMACRLAGEEVIQDFCFELFAHTTELFGYQVILLGKYNGQGYGTNYEILIRSTPNLEYIKLVLVENKLQGAILIGDTGLEETFENLILNQIDLSPYGDDILDPNIDVEDYFD